MKNAVINIRINPELKSELQELYASYGITLTEAINIFLHQSRNVGGLPFDLRRTPNSETLEAFQEIEDMKNGNIPKKSQTVKELFEELNINVDS